MLEHNNGFYAARFTNIINNIIISCSILCIYGNNEKVQESNKKKKNGGRSFLTSAEPPPSPPPGVSVPSLKSLRTHVGRSTVRLRSQQTYTTSNVTAADRPYTGTGCHNAHAWPPRELVSIRAAPTASFTPCTGHRPRFSVKLYPVSCVIITIFTNYGVAKHSSPSWPTTAAQCRFNNSWSVGRWPAFTARRWRSRRPTAAVCVAADPNDGGTLGGSRVAALSQNITTRFAVNAPCVRRRKVYYRQNARTTAAFSVPDRQRATDAFLLF